MVCFTGNFKRTEISLVFCIVFRYPTSYKDLAKFSDTFRFGRDSGDQRIIPDDISIISVSLYFS